MNLSGNPRSFDGSTGSAAVACDVRLPDGTPSRPSATAPSDLARLRLDPRRGRSSGASSSAATSPSARPTRRGSGPRRTCRRVDAAGRAQHGRPSTRAARACWPLSARWADRLRHRLRRNSLRGSRGNIRYHYDLGEDFYSLFLDPSLTYSCAIFDPPGISLADAQLEKLERIGRALELAPGRPAARDRNGLGRPRRSTPRRRTAAGSRRRRSAAPSTTVREPALERRARGPGRAALRGLPQALGTIRQGRVDRDVRGRGPRGTTTTTFRRRGSAPRARRRRCCSRRSG